MGSCPDTDTDPLSPLQSIESPLIHNGNRMKQDPS